MIMTYLRGQESAWVSPPTCDVIHNDGCGRVSDVTWDEATETLLPCCVPQLQPDLWDREGERMGGETKEKKKKQRR